MEPSEESKISKKKSSKKVLSQSLFKSKQKYSENKEITDEEKSKKLSLLFKSHFEHKIHEQLNEIEQKKQQF